MNVVKAHRVRQTLFRTELLIAAPGDEHLVAQKAIPFFVPIWVYAIPFSHSYFHRFVLTASIAILLISVMGM